MKRSRSGAGFTLVEVLAALVVFALLVLLMSQAVTLADQALGINERKLDADSDARLFFDRLQADLAAWPNRPDLQVNFAKATGNDSLQFYSAVDGYSGARQLTTVAYRIQQTTPGRIYQLERGASGTDWVADANPLAQFLPNAPAAPPETDFEVLGQDIFRLEFCYLLNTGQLVSNSYTPPANGAPDSSVVALVVAVGVLDARSRLTLSSAQLATLAGQLDDSQDKIDPLALWIGTDLARPTFGAGLPRAAIQNVRVYERTFRVP